MELAVDVLGISVLTIVVGLVLTFFGYTVLRFAIALYGALIGFAVGGYVIASVTGEGFLATAATWIGAVVGALVVGAVAYLFYQAAVLVGLAMMGFGIGAGIVQIFWGGDGPGWLVWVAGLGVAVLFVAIGVAGNLPAVLLIVATALAGAETAVAGVMLLTGLITMDQLQEVGSDIVLDRGTVWVLAALALAVVGAAVQVGAWRGKQQRAALARAQAVE